MDQFVATCRDPGRRSQQIIISQRTEWVRTSMLSRTTNWHIRAWSLQTAAYILTFGMPTVVAIIVLLTRQPPDWPKSAADLYLWTGRASFVATAVVLWSAHRWLGLSGAELGLHTERPPATGYLQSVGVAYLAMWLGLQAMMLFPEWTTGSSDPTVARAVERSVRAGVVEELILLALPMAIMTRLRLPWWIQLTVLTTLRLPFHLYYGPAAVALAVVWCSIAWFAYSRIRHIWPFILAHILYDFNVSVMPLGIWRLAISFVMTTLGIVALISLTKRTLE
ncbi:CPBP family glutamic-type intramembrane protease [Nocardia seriolae]|uniref:CAAX prenyl protease 2/Lysostaphin resistance protein A-like domain-containing protein n=2 Tax=Nocardia seriolae TaxID=37332 RepID=A0ABC9Z1Y9_9NOCA|nr:CPBP family glutamic-type intramembrane protease [Nocardia seriolae]GEM27355.1 hypothetical protein NS2_55940 [Nocardia seriolae NBRC 15557]APA96282.1 hypothetical protein NS506_02216 [Nocardia seriolae]OJF82400.1 hypothetical protein NS14008_28715 [Nocardia seriolae]PSK28182.1 hypothetical protein C6575_27930 [Nocardia seriolae]QOW33148.1 hypothetical protein IMZ23_35830 [Nocardia seriolae]